MRTTSTSTGRVVEPDMHDTAVLLRATRGLSAVAAMFLAVQLFGNLYEEIVGNVASIAHPRVGALVGELAPGSPLYYYLPWAPLGVVLVAVLAARLRRRGAPTWVTRRTNGALVALVVAAVAKIALITRVNPRFRDPSSDVETLRGWAVVWAFGNGVGIVAVAAALALLLAWRARLLDMSRIEGREHLTTGRPHS